MSWRPGNSQIPPPDRRRLDRPGPRPEEYTLFLIMCLLDAQVQPHHGRHHPADRVVIPDVLPGAGRQSPRMIAPVQQILQRAPNTDPVASIEHRCCLIRHYAVVYTAPATRHGHANAHRLKKKWIEN